MLSRLVRRVAADEESRCRWYLFAAGCLWSLAGLFIKFLPVPPLTIVFYRSLFAGASFAFFARRSGPWPARPLLFSAAAYTAAISAFVAANKLTTAANAIVLQYTAPMFVFLAAAVWFRENIQRVTWLGLALGMAGIGVIFIGSAGEPDFSGVSLALLSGVLFAAYMVNLRFLGAVSPAALTCFNNLACCLLLLPFVGADGSLSWREGGILAIMGTVQLGLPYALFSRGVQRVAVHEASLIVLIEPILNPLWVALAVGELPSLSTVAGGVLILAGLAVRYGFGRAGDGSR